MDVIATNQPPRTRPLAETNWPAFVETYGRAVLQWYRDSGFSTVEIAAIVPQMMQSLRGDFAQLGGADRFRLWLRRAGETAWGSLGSDVASRRESFLQALDEVCSHQRRREVLPRVQARAHEKDWEMFYGAVFGEIPEADVAAHMQTTPRLVRAAVFRVYRLLEDELKCVEEQF